MYLNPPKILPRRLGSYTRFHLGCFTFALIALVFPVQGAPLLEIPEGTYRWTENWRYEKTYSSVDTIIVKKDLMKRVVFYSRNSDGSPESVFFPNGSFVRVLSDSRGLWLGDWSVMKNGDLEIIATAGRHAARIQMKRNKTRLEWTWTGSHSFKGSRIGTGWGKLIKVK